MLQTAFNLALNYIGIKEITGNVDNAIILSWLKDVAPWAQHDEVPWCSAFVNAICKKLDLPRTDSAAARSWLKIGTSITLKEAAPANDIVILSRGNNPAQGHVGFFAGINGANVQILGGNQGDQVSIRPFPISRILAIKRL